VTALDKDIESVGVVRVKPFPFARFHFKPLDYRLVVL
jgi:hypothetical protein